MPDHKMGDLPLGLFDQLGPGGPVVGFPVFWIVILVGKIVFSRIFGSHLPGNLDRAIGAFQGIGQNQLRSQGLHDLDPLRAGVGGHGQGDGDAQGSPEGRVGDAHIAGC